MPTPETDSPHDYGTDKTARMPKRTRTRAQHRAQRITTERHHNRTTRQSQHAQTTADTGPAPPDHDEPPPF